MNKATTPVKVPELKKALAKHPDRCFVFYLLSGLIHGFFAGLCTLPAKTFVCRNLQSALKEPDVVDTLLAREIEKGYMIGPFDKAPYSNYRINPIGVATRKYSGKKRLIVDLSSPHHGSEDSINSLIPLEPFSLFYATVDHAIRMIKIAGKGAWLGKADIVDAFKTMPLHPSQWPLFGVKWREKMYFAVRLTFGCRSSPNIFNTLSEALCWILNNNYRLPFVLHLLDDFLVIDFPNSQPERSIKTVKEVFAKLGVPLSLEKTVGPVKNLEFLGIILDSELMQASLPLEKLERIREIMQHFLDAVSISKQELLSLLGHLNFAMRIIPQGRSFIARLLDLSKSVVNLFDIVHLDEGSRSDLRFWSTLCNEWNGISFFHNDAVESSLELGFFTDAAPSIGFGGFFNNEWFADSWPNQLLDLPKDVLSSALFELYPVVIAAMLWGDKWSRKRIVVFCDNEATVHIINKGRSSVPIINRFVRRLTWTSVLSNFTIRACHIPGLDNKIADALSRFKFQEFRNLCPNAAPSSLRCPAFDQIVLD